MGQGGSRSGKDVRPRVTQLATRHPARSFTPKNVLVGAMAGLLAPGSTAHPRLPRAKLQWRQRRTSPVTVAGAAPVSDHRSASGRAEDRMTLGRLPCFTHPRTPTLVESQGRWAPSRRSQL